MRRPSLRPRSIFLYILLPLIPVSAGVVALTLALVSAPLEESYTARQETSLRLATRLGLGYCEELFQDLLSLRLSEDPGMVQTSRQEALHRIVEVSRRFPDLHTAAVAEDGTFIASSLAETGESYRITPLPKGPDELQEREISSRPVLLHSRYFPFWRWHVAAFAYRSTLAAPVSMIRGIVGLSLSGVVAVLLLTVLITIQFTVKRPLANIIAAAGRISRGELPLIESPRRDEIGKVTAAVNNMVYGLRGLHREREAAMQRLRESERRFRRIVENSQAGYFFMNPEGRIRRVNDAWLRLYGYSSQDEVAGKHIDELRGTSEENQRRTRSQLELLRAGESIPSGEAVRLNRDGSLGFHTFSASPVYRNDILEGYEGFVIDITERRRYQEALEHSLSEKEVLLQEIHHRVKNNLNVVVSLLNLQADRISGVEDARKALLNSRNRIFSMALVHENLYQSSSLAAIDLRSYLQSMINQLTTIYSEGKEITMDLQIDEGELSITQAVPCALILNELITNSFLHAYPQQRQGRITVSFREDGEGNWELLYEDDGVGLAEHEEGEEEEVSLGMNLIQVLSSQLEGTETVDSAGGGFRFRLLFPRRGSPAGGSSG